MRTTRKWLAVLPLVAMLLMGAEGCPVEEKQPRPEPTQLESTRWTNE